MSASSESNPGTEGGGASNRIRCLYCGASNLSTMAICWQCGRPLKPLPAGMAANPSISITLPSLPPVPAGQTGRPAFEENTLAVKAAVSLGLMFPYVAIPVGIVFLMLDDPRKARLGWITIGWSVAGTVASALLFLITLGPLLALVKSLLPSVGHGGGLPGLPTSGANPGDLFISITTAWSCGGKLCRLP